MKIMEKDLNSFISILGEFGVVYGPVKETGKLYNFTEISDYQRLSLNYTRTMIPPKKFLLKTREPLYQLNTEKGFNEILDDSKIILLGVHHCDVNAINFLDKVYLSQLSDPYYKMRRENTIIIGVSCQPDGNCFCTSTGSSYANQGFDLFLHEIDDGYLTRIGSLKGNQIIHRCQEIFREASALDIENFKQAEAERLEKISLKLNVNGIQDILDLSYESSVWRENADICFGCGSCNLVCPTCRCYDVLDYLKLDLKNGVRLRRWDSCMLKQHALVAGGLNFRPSRIERLFNRFNCKMSLSEASLNCVGCGRCTVYCPADINFVEVLKQVRGEG
ncbi:MAG: 4Fe-4S dicluster domain-containing protein [Candidatus Odinarchaeota archaeon]